MTMGGGNFFYFLSQYLLVAAMPLYILEELHGNERDAGLAMTYFQLGTVLCRPFAGKIIDSLNKHRLLVAGSCAFLLIMTAFFFLRTLPAVFGLRFLHGAIFGVTSTAAAAVAALVLPLSRKGEGIGYFALSTNLAMVVGPLVGLLLMQYWGPSAVFFFLILGALFTLIAMICNALPSSVTRPSASFRSFSVTDLIEPRSVIPSLFGGLVFFSYGGMLTFIPLYARSLGLASVTSLFFVVFALIIIVTRPVIGHLFDTKGPDYIVYPGFIVFLLGFILFASISSLTGLLLSGAVLGLGFGALSPAFQTLGDRAADCGGIMDPIAVWVRKNGEWAIVHRCRRCGAMSSNRVAADDNPMKLMSIAMKPLCSPPFPIERIRELTALMGGDGALE